MNIKNELLLVFFLTVKADRPLCRLVPGPVLQTSDIVLLQGFVHFKVEVLILACVADISVELYGLTIPLKSKESFLRRIRGVKTGNPFAGVKAVKQGPAGVPVASHPTLVVVFSSLGVQELPRHTTLVSQTRTIGT